MKFLYFGSKPPPIGGVTVSIYNYASALKKRGHEVSYFSPKSLLRRYDISHGHYSKPWKRALAVIIGRLLSRKVLFTVHGKYLDTESILNRIAIKLCDGVILLNKSTYDYVVDYMSNRKCVALLPSLFPEGDHPLSKIGKKITLEKNRNYKYFLVYAQNRYFHKGKEIYGISFVLNSLGFFPEDVNLILVDISKEYRDDVKSFKNIIYIDEEVDFSFLLNQVDVYLRPTAMDGDSLAVREALTMNVPVVASDVVPRPEGVCIYKYEDTESFIECIRKASISSGSSESQKGRVSIDDYIDFCARL
ncbi:hypothetical protein [Alcanivorax sp. 24]|uniref:hypothetical protein n=1 Tax=Alcanivorax sp. 24 TaxID=2545266 RepID=UPI0010608776|nr:hypothetical protein [Alcanivorax sp. 24]